MTNNLRDLCQAVNNAVNYIVRATCACTRDGQFVLRIKDVLQAINMELDEFNKCREFILSELNERPEIAETRLTETSADTLTVFCNRLYCPMYKWPEEEKPPAHSALPISQPIDTFRMAELGKGFIAAMIEEEPERAQNLLKDKLSASSEELLHLGFSANQAFQLETMEALYAAVIETEEDDDSNENEDPSVSNSIEQENELKNLAASYIQELEKDEPTEKVDSNLDINDEVSSASAIEEVREKEDATALLEKAKEKAVLSLLENDCQYSYLKSTDESRLSDYVSMYNDLVSMFMPRPNDKFIVQSTSNSTYNGRLCSIIEPAVLGQDYAYKVLFVPEASSDDQQQSEETSIIRFEDLIPYKSNDLAVGKWRIHLVSPGERFGKNHLVVNNNEILVEFWDMLAGMEMARSRDFNRGRFRNYTGMGPSEASNHLLETEGARRRKIAPLYARQGQFTGGRYCLSQILEGYKKYLETNDSSLVQGLCLSKEYQNARTVSSSEMCKILRWLQCRPVSAPVIFDVKGEIEVPLELFHEQDEIASYVENKLSAVHGVSNLDIGQFGRSKHSTIVPFSLQTSLKENGIEPIIQMLLSDCEVVLSVSSSSKDNPAHSRQTASQTG